MEGVQLDWFAKIVVKLEFFAPVLVFLRDVGRICYDEVGVQQFPLDIIIFQHVTGFITIHFGHIAVHDDELVVAGTGFVLVFLPHHLNS